MPTFKVSKKFVRATKPVQQTIVKTAKEQITSDERVKENLQLIENPLSILQALTGYTYDKYKTLEKSGSPERSAGLLAQKVLDVFPEAVHVPNHPEVEIYGIYYNRLIPVLLEAIKEQQKQIELLQKITRGKNQKIRNINEQYLQRYRRYNKI